MYSPQTGLKLAGDQGADPAFDNHRRRVDEIWEKTMNSTAKSKTQQIY
jgi:hypothetical protein